MDYENKSFDRHQWPLFLAWRVLSAHPKWSLHTDHVSVDGSGGDDNSEGDGDDSDDGAGPGASGAPTPSSSGDQDPSPAPRGATPVPDAMPLPGSPEPIGNKRRGGALGRNAAKAARLSSRADPAVAASMQAMAHALTRRVDIAEKQQDRSERSRLEDLAAERRRHEAREDRSAVAIAQATIAAASLTKPTDEDGRSVANILRMLRKKQESRLQAALSADGLGGDHTAG